MEDDEPSQVLKLTEDQVAEYRELFSFYDKDCDGFIPTHELGSYLRSVGLNPSEAEIEDLMDDFKGNDDKKVELKECLQVIALKLQETQETEESLREAFRTFDRDGAGYLQVDEFQQIMMQHGEKLSEHEVKEMVEMGDDGTGVIRYEDFVTAILNKRNDMTRLYSEI